MCEAVPWQRVSPCPLINCLSLIHDQHNTTKQSLLYIFFRAFQWKTKIWGCETQGIVLRIDFLPRFSLGLLFCLFILIKCQSLDLMSFFLRKKQETSKLITSLVFKHLYHGCYCLGLLQEERKNDGVPFSQHDMILYIVLMLFCSSMFYWGLFDHHLKIDISRTKK